MRYVALCSCAAILVGCTKAEQQPPNAAASAPAAMAGTWRVRGFNEAGDSVVGYELVATSDTSGWALRLPNREPIQVRVVAVSGDSVITEVGPYESVLRPGVQVRTHSAFRLQGDSLVGNTVAHYTTSGADSVLRIRSLGTRAP